MRFKILTLFSTILLLLITMTACGASPTQVAAPAATQSIHSSTSSPAPASTDASQPQPTNTSTSSTGGVSFAHDVMPIFESSCINCHGGQSTKEGLDLKTYAALMAGSRNGSVVTPGNANDSYLVEQLLNGKMPKRGPKLTPDQIQVIVNWVNSGALNN